MMVGLSIATDCKGVIDRLKNLNRIVTMSTALHPIVREILHLKKTRCKSLNFIKVAAHQDDIQEVDKLSFLEQLNVRCDIRAKELILSIEEDATIPFPLILSSPYVLNDSNQLVLNYPKDTRLHAYLTCCKPQLVKSLGLYNLDVIDWSLRSNIIDNTPKYLHLWLSKSLHNFTGATHQLHRQKLCSSPTCRCCLIEPELDALHMLDCTHQPLVNFKQHLLIQLQ